MLKDFFEFISSFFSQNGPFLKLGFRPKIKNGDLMLRKRYSKQLELTIYQSIEPYNPSYQGLIDFEIENACVVFSFSKDYPDKEKTVNKLRDYFDFSYFREGARFDFLFSMLRDMEFDDSKLLKRLEEIDKLLSI